MAKGKDLGLLLLADAGKGGSKSESDEKTNDSAMEAAAAAALGAQKRGDAKAYADAMRNMFDAFMMAGPPEK